MSGRLDDEKLETLRIWGTGLTADGRPELRAAGKAILILVGEIERLQVDAWHPRERTPEPSSDAPSSGEVVESSVEALAEEFFSSGQSPGTDSTSSRRARRRWAPRSRESR